jgi:hypothetical protein
MLVIICGGLIASFLGLFKTRYKGEKTPSWIGWATFIAGIFVIVGGLWSGIVQNKSDEEKSKLTKQILNLTEKNARLNQDINNIATGGNSYCYITFGPWETDIKTLHGNINHEGTFPLYDLTITLYDMIKYRELETKIDSKSGYYVGDMNKIMKTINIGNINPGLNIANMWHLRLPHLLKVDNYKEYKVNVFYGARNGSWVQLVRLKKVRLGESDYWAQAINVRRDKEVLFENIDANYPRNINGKVEW